MSKKRERFHELVAEKNDKSAVLEEFKVKRSEALISGAPFASGEIVGLESEIAALDDAITTVEKSAIAEEGRERAAAQAANLECRQDEITNKVDAYVAAAAAAQGHSLALAEALVTMNRLAIEIDRAATPTAEESSISALNQQNVAYRMSERFCGTLAPLDPNNSGVYGIFRWLARPAISEDWAKAEWRLVTGALSLSRRNLSAKISELKTGAGEE